MQIISVYAGVKFPHSGIIIIYSLELIFKTEVSHQPASQPCLRTGTMRFSFEQENIVPKGGDFYCFDL